MKKTALLSLLLALTIIKAFAYTEVPGFNGPTWQDYRETITEGSGTESSPYLIRTPGQLAQLAYDVNYGNDGNGDSKEGVHYQLAADISLDKREDGKRVLWVPIGLSDSKLFKGTLTNPDGHVIEMMMIDVNSAATTRFIGLFGCLQGTVDGIRIAGDSEIRLSNGGNYEAGLLCGNNDEYSYVNNCRVENSYITGKNFSSTTKIGGLVGSNYTFGENGRMTSCIVKNVTIKLEGNGSATVYAGGIAGESTGKVLDCHALMLNLTATNFSTSTDSYLGGVIGFVRGGPVKYCSASGDIKAGTGMHAITGGAFGKIVFLTSGQKIIINCCVSTAAISGGHTLGGLIGHCYLNNSLQVDLDLSFSGSFVNAEDATYAGGFIGHLEYNRRSSNREYFHLTQAATAIGFCGTMKRPRSGNNYGAILGYTTFVPDENFSQMIWQLYYNPDMCNFQLNHKGLGMGNKAYDYGGQIPNDDGYGTWGISYGDGSSLANPAPTAQTLDKIEMCNTDNYVLCTLLFYITNDGKTLYNATDVTVDFSIEDITNSATGERAAFFTVPDNMTCVKVDGKHIYPLDPGEVVVTINWNGLQRKVHLDITYGIEWTGGTNVTPDQNYVTVIDPTTEIAKVESYSDGSAEKPWLIHNAEQFYGILRHKDFNKEGVHFRLANDIFFNNHLLQEDGTPRSNAKAWTPFDFKGVLDGNGKTIYGLYVKHEGGLEQGKSLGIFNNFYGTVKNLAIVDSYVGTTRASYIDSSTGLLCGVLKEGASVSNCLFHGEVSSDTYCGGIAGKCDTENTSITNCFASVHVTWPEGATHPIYAGGMCYDTPATMAYCFSTGRVEEFTWGYGICESSRTTCYFDKQMQAGAKNGTYIVQEEGRTTAAIVAGNLMKDSDAWQQDSERYPMLKTFADTPYGKLLAMPVLFDTPDNGQEDKAGDVNYIFEFPTDDVVWSALHNDTYIDVINDCGAASLVKETGDNIEMLIAQAENVKSQCTRAMRTLPLNLRTGLTSFRFKDPVAQTAAQAAFDNEDPKNILTLRELTTATKEDFTTFNEKAQEAQYFPEFRYFTTITELEEGMISNLSKLSELQLPKKLQTIKTEAFTGCASLADITLPATFTTLEVGGLYGSGIKNLLVNPKHPSMESIAGALYQTDTEGHLHLVAYPPGRGEADATISAKLQWIDDNAFYKIPGLQNVYIDNCLPEGNLVLAADFPIVHEDESDLMHVYINDGSYNLEGGVDQHLLYDQYKEDVLWGDYYDEDHLHLYYPLNVTGAGWATLYIGFPAQLPEGVNAYIASESDAEVGHIVTLKNIGRIVPATTPVVIKAAEGLYPLYKYDGIAPTIPKYKNRFNGSWIGQKDNGKERWGIAVNQETSITGGVLTLGHNRDGDVGFFKFKGSHLPPYRSYLPANIIKEESSAKPFCLFSIEDDIDESLFEDIPTAVQPARQHATESDRTTYYDVTGRRLPSKPTRRGIYIVNGKKHVNF